jgi:hypothetical protein
MVKFPNLDSAMTFARAMDGMAPGPDLDRVMRSANDGWGFADVDGTIDGNNGFWVDAGTPKIGTMNLPDFLRLSKKARLDYLNSDVFSGSVMSRVSKKMEVNFSPNSKKTLERGAEAVKQAKDEFMDASGKVVKGTKKVEFDSLMTKFSKAMKFSAVAGVGIWTVTTLLKLAEAGSGCFLVGPDGQEEKVSKEDCSCSGETNPNADKCCQACNSGGDAFLCPGTEWTGDNPPPNYVCPRDVPEAGRARRMRSAISVSAARARDIAQGMVAANATSEPTNVASCGCVKAGMWILEQREKNIFGVMADLLAGAGKMLKKMAEGVWDIIEDTFIKPMGDIIKIVFIVIGVVIGLALVAGITVAVVKATKKRKTLGK